MTGELRALAAIAALAAMPGPTNALLATAGALRGIRRSLHLILCVLLAYAGTVGFWQTLLWLAAPGPLASRGLRLGTGLFAAWLALRAWRSGPERQAGLASDRQVLLATLLNPKALILVVTLLPLLPHGLTLRDLLAAALIVGLVSFAYIAAGCRLAAGASARTVARATATVLALFALLLIGSVLRPHA